MNGRAHAGDAALAVDPGADRRLVTGDIVEGEVASGETYTIACHLDRDEPFAAMLMAFDRPFTIDVSGPDDASVTMTQAEQGPLRQIQFAAGPAGRYHLRLTAPADGRVRRFALRVHPPRGPQAVTNGMALPHPAIVALHEASRGGAIDGDVLSTFWTRVAEAGTPLVEDRDPAAPMVTVTFVWRGTSDTRQVSLLAAGERRLIQVPHTDVWFGTFPIRRGTRLPYAFLATSGERRAYRDEAALDPWNTERFPERAEASGAEASDGSMRSVLTVPGAPATFQALRQPAARAGRIVTETFDSRVLNNRRPLWIYTPPGYEAASDPCALLLMFDGELYRGPIGLPRVLDALIADGVVPPTVAVMIGSPGPGTRWHELRCTTPIVEALRDELVPWVRQRLRVRGTPAETIVGGSSRGGLAAAWVALCAPETFGGALCQSGAFWWAPDGEPVEIERFTPYYEPNWLAREVIRRPRVPVRFSLSAGTYEGSDSDQATILEHSRHLRDVLTAKGYDVAWRECLGGHDELTWREALPDALRALLGDAGTALERS